MVHSAGWVKMLQLISNETLLTVEAVEKTENHVVPLPGPVWGCEFAPPKAEDGKDKRKKKNTAWSTTRSGKQQPAKHMSTTEIGKVAREKKVWINDNVELLLRVP